MVISRFGTPDSFVMTRVIVRAGVTLYWAEGPRCEIRAASAAYKVFPILFGESCELRQARVQAKAFLITFGLGGMD
jgi:hypothetical protein